MTDANQTHDGGADGASVPGGETAATTPVHGPSPGASHGQQGHGGHGGQGGHDHAAMIADFRRRFWITLVLTPPILLLSPMIQEFLGLTDALAFPGSGLVLFGLSTIVFFYGGWPFLTGFISEVTTRKTGMMTLISLAITVAYVYSTATVFGLAGEPFFWEGEPHPESCCTPTVLRCARANGRLGPGAPLSLVAADGVTADRVRPDGTERGQVSVSDLRPGDSVLCGRGPRCRRPASSSEGRTSPGRVRCSRASRSPSSGPRARSSSSAP